MNRNPSTHYEASQGAAYCYAFPAAKLSSDWRKVNCKKCKLKKEREKHDK